MSDAMYLSEAPGAEPAHGGTAGRVIYAIGDVHGRYDLLKPLLGQIITDIQSRDLDQRPLLIFCGDYVDRGSQSPEVVEAIVWLKARPEYEVRALKGNHEQALLEFLERPEEGRGWLRFGGRETLAAYGVPPPMFEDDVSAFVRARDDFRERLPPEHLTFLKELELMVVVGAYAFVHAGVRPGVPLVEQQEADLLWIRDAFLNDQGPFERVIVHGHTWTGEAQIHPHRLGIDTGAYKTGLLTAVRLDGDTVRLFDTSEERMAGAA